MTSRMRAVLELALSALSGICCAATLAWPEWIEAVFGVDPDGGSGSLEIALALATASCAIALAALGRRELRRPTAASV